MLKASYEMSLRTDPICASGGHLSLFSMACLVVNCSFEDSLFSISKNSMYNFKPPLFTSDFDVSIKE